MNLKMSFLAAVSVALFAVSANAEIIHESDFEAEPAVGFGLNAETMLFNDAGGDMAGFSANNNSVTSGDSCGISAANPFSGSYSYVNDVGATTDTGGGGFDDQGIVIANPGVGNGWGAAWCGQNTENGSGGFSTQAVADAAGDGCYVDFSAGATFTVTCQIATDPLNPLTGPATGEVRLEFNFEDPTDPAARVADLIARQPGITISTRLGVADLVPVGTYHEATISYTLTQADIDDVAARVAAGTLAAGVEINSVAAVMAIEGAGFGSSTGHILFDDFVFEVDSAHVVVVGEGHATDVLKGDVDMDGDVDFSDIPGFIGVLQSQGFQAEADCDCNLVVNFSDIPAFIAILQNQ